MTADLKETNPVGFNRDAEAAFLALTDKLVPCSVSVLLQEAAYELDVSVETVKRYLTKHTARRATLRVTRGIVTVKRKEVMQPSKQSLPQS